MSKLNSKFDYGILTGCFGRLNTIANTISDNNYKLPLTKIKTEVSALKTIKRFLTKYIFSVADYKNIPIFTPALIKRIQKLANNPAILDKFKTIDTIYKSGNSTKITV